MKGAVVESAAAPTAHQLQVQARAVVEKSQRLLDRASDDDREDIINLIEKITDALTMEDLSAGVNAPMAELSDLLFYLES